jgi:hypothetical protein
MQLFHSLINLSWTLLPKTLLATNFSRTFVAWGLTLKLPMTVINNSVTWPLASIGNQVLLRKEGLCYPPKGQYSLMGMGQTWIEMLVLKQVRKTLPKLPSHTKLSLTNWPGQSSLTGPWKLMCPPLVRMDHPMPFHVCLGLYQLNPGLQNPK